MQKESNTLEGLEKQRLRLPSAASSEVSLDFMQGMADRMAVSFHKYGPIADAYPDKVNAIDSLIARLAKYRATKNKEYLMDAANFAMIEFMRPSVRGAFFKATDHEGSPGRVWNADDFGDVEISRRANDGTPQG